MTALEQPKQSPKVNTRFHFYIGDHAIIIALIVFWLALFLTNPAFSNISVYSAIIKQGAIFAVCGIGMTFAITSGVFDLSVASQIALSSVVFTHILTRISPDNPAMGILLSCLVIIGMGLVMGLINGSLVALLRIPAFITTLAMQMAYRGLAQLVNEWPVAIATLPEEYHAFTTGAGSATRLTIGSYEWFFGRGFGFTRIFELPLFFYLMVVLAVIGTIIYRKTALGRNTLAIGNSKEAARISGINIPKTQISIFVLVGFFTAITALMMTSHQGMSNYGVPVGTEFTVISAVVLGGTALKGGKGSILNTVVASMFIATISTALTTFGIDNNAHGIFNGIILVFAFSINTLRAYADDAIVKYKARKKLKTATAASSAPQVGD
jgi:ribose/xylose/arabinose/galactoside ABC-type transport system permease subunit